MNLTRHVTCLPRVRFGNIQTVLRTTLALGAVASATLAAGSTAQAATTELAPSPTTSALSTDSGSLGPCHLVSQPRPAIPTLVQQMN